MEEWGGADHMGLFLKISVCRAEAPGGHIHAVGVAEGGVWEGTENTVLEVPEDSQRTSPEAAKESPKCAGKHVR